MRQDDSLLSRQSNRLRPTLDNHLTPQPEGPAPHHTPRLRTISGDASSSERREQNQIAKHDHLPFLVWPLLTAHCLTSTTSPDAFRK
jgi:hypothetical protein